ncbi:type I restriction enzyme HsdR N-terminal domain-containing protein [Chlamydiia bacterium]|nr:type I restriction enzyme HsdR N-terminal domain-containing protein [Chlamydiia bacterium]
MKLLPEEKVRQDLIDQLVSKHGFPQSTIVVEKKVLKHDLNLQNRFDLLVYTKDSSTQMRVLLLIECKAKKPTQDGLYQLLGYNSHIKAPFVALAWDKGFIYCNTQNPDAQWQTHLPDYQTLLSESTR